MQYFFKLLVFVYYPIVVNSYARRKGRWIGVLVLVSYAVIAGGLASFISKGWRLASLLVAVLTTPSLMVLASWQLERRPLLPLVNPATQSWVALFADTFGLLVAVAVLATA